MNKGKKKCEVLKKIRQTIAKQLELMCSDDECNHEGDCSGTCPRCDQELKDLQRQLDERGITDIQTIDIKSKDISTDTIDTEVLAGIPAPLEEEGYYITEGDVMPEPKDLEGETILPFERGLYKECKIAGTSFRDLDDVWDELYIGAKLALVREKDNPYDSNAVAVACAEDYDGDPDDFDFDFILGYIPRTENEDIAKLLDLGWEECLECEIIDISRKKGGDIYIAIYYNDKPTTENIDKKLWAVWQDKLDYAVLIDELVEKGFYTLFLYEDQTRHKELPEIGDKVVYLYLRGDDVTLYLMRVIANGEKSYPFLDDDEKRFIDNDSIPYIFTNIKGPLVVNFNVLKFLDNEDIPDELPKNALSETATRKLYKILNIPK